MSITITDVLLDGLWAALAASGFAAVSNPPKKAFIYVALIAAIGHIARFIMIKYFGWDLAISSLGASVIIGMMAVVIGVKIHIPSEVFSFPALLPMVPGFLGYKALLGIIHFMQTTDKVIKMSLLPGIISNGISAILIMFSLGVGVSIPMLLFQKRMDIASRREQKGYPRIR